MTRLRGKLIAAARAARRKAYAPYSGYEVGAAIASSGRRGDVFTGANVENASFGATICAERVALLGAVAAGHRKFSALAVVTPGRVPAPPCGMCLQSLAEFCGDLEVYLAAAEGGKVIETSLRRLLPVRFAGPVS